MNLPAGLIGDTRAVPQCTDAEFTTINEKGLASECPPETAIGAAQAYVFEPILVGPYGVSTPVFNLVPAQGEPARFGFQALGLFPIVIDTAVRSGGDYGVVVNIDNATEGARAAAEQPRHVRGASRRPPPQLVPRLPNASPAVGRSMPTRHPKQPQIRATERS